jgi:hypothetical protein
MKKDLVPISIRVDEVVYSAAKRRYNNVPALVRWFLEQLASGKIAVEEKALDIRIIREKK